ncbi:MAG: DUF1841 family protein [Gammaproteobacteria bacterium]|jgi:hypothetical protein
MIVQDRNASRQVFYNVWDKHRQGDILEPLESLILSIIQQHPGYHPILNDAENMANDFENAAENHNPFLHMGLHIAIMEQVTTDRPPGITSLYTKMLGKCLNEHALQHKFMECLEQSLWLAQNQGQPDDEKNYLESLRMLSI